MELNKPLVSVVMPVFNAEAYILESVNSMLNQSYIHLELIIVDDACTDSTMEKIQMIKDDRIVILRQTNNSGLASCLNQAIRYAHGAFLARMDADDISLPDRIEQQLLAMEREPTVAVLGTGMQYFGASTYKNYFPPSHELCKSKLLFNVCCGHSSILMKREVFEKNENFYNAALEQYSEDYDLFVRLIGQYRFMNLQKLLVRYRTYPPSLKKYAEDRRRTNSKAVRNRMLGAMGVYPSEQEQVIHQLGADLTIHKDKTPLNDIAAWFDFLLEKNKSSGYFNEASLKVILSEQLFMQVYHNAHLNVNLEEFRHFNFFSDYRIPPYLSLRRRAKWALNLFR